MTLGLSMSNGRSLYVVVEGRKTERKASKGLLRGENYYVWGKRSLRRVESA